MNVAGMVKEETGLEQDQDRRAAPVAEAPGRASVGKAEARGGTGKALAGARFRGEAEDGRPAQRQLPALVARGALLWLR